MQFTIFAYMKKSKDLKKQTPSKQKKSSKDKDQEPKSFGETMYRLLRVNLNKSDK
jgi:hypothetical protein